MKNVMLPATGIASLGLMLACSSAFGQGESPGSADMKTAATAPNYAKGSVEVKLTEYKIDMPALIGAGATTFNVTNMGSKTHGFEIEGSGIEKALKPRLKDGEKGSLQVDLKPGTYKVYCPVIGHKWHGMSIDLTVK
ncbi:MAG: copper-binding protein [Steroidobacteraceae bacterium]|jgi:uncharacterized cupredoxin-like copper-binding protein